MLARYVYTRQLDDHRDNVERKGSSLLSVKLLVEIIVRVLPNETRCHLEYTCTVVVSLPSHPTLNYLIICNPALSCRILSCGIDSSPFFPTLPMSGFLRDGRQS